MKRGITLLLIAVLCVFGLMLASGLIVSSLVSGSGKARLVGALETATGVPVTFGNASFDLTQWFLLRPSIAIEDITIGNPPGYRSPHLLEAGKLSAQVALLPLIHKIIEVHSIEIDRPRIFAETNAQGISNIEALLKKAKGKPSVSSSAGSGSSAPSGEALSVDEFSINSGEVALLDSGASHAEGNLDISGIDLRVRDFSSDKPCTVLFSAKLFKGSASSIKLDGHAGPFSANALPIGGNFSVTIALDEIPPAFRRSQFGNLIAVPGKKARVTLEATIGGDAYQKLSGPAKLGFTDILIGKDEQHVLPLKGNLSAAFAALKLVSAPRFQLNVANAELDLGKGQWLGAAELELHGTAISGKSNGKIKNVDINEMLSAMTPANGKIYGTLEIPTYSLEFAGSNADQLRSSLHGTAKFSVTQGRLAALDLLEKIEHPEQLLTGKKSDTPFTTLSTDLAVGQSKLNLEAIQLDSPVLRVTGQGVIGFDQTLNFQLTGHLGSGGQVLNAVSSLGQRGGGGIPVTITGTVESPQVRPAVGKMVENVAGGLLNSFLKKKSN